MIIEFPDNINRYYINGEFNRAIDEIQKLPIDEITKEFYTIICLIEKSDYLLAEERLNNILKKTDDNDIQFKLKIYLTECALRSGKIQDAENLLNELDYTIIGANTIENNAIYYKIKAMYEWFSGELNNAHNYANKSRELCIAGKLYRDIIFIDNLLGIIYLRLGKFNEALEKFFMLQNNNNVSIQYQAIAKVNMATIYMLQGNLDRALNDYINGNEIFLKLGHVRHAGDTYKNIGLCYFRKGNYDKAITALQESLKLRTKINNTLEIAETVFWLAMLYFDKEEYNEVVNYMTILENIKQNNDNKILKCRYMIIKALFLTHSGRIRDTGRAMDILYELINEEVVDHELKVITMLSYFELLVKELRSNKNLEIINEIDQLSEKLQDIATQQNSKMLLADIYWLRAQVEIIKQNIKQAKIYLTQAQFIAEENELTKLAKKISFEHDKLLTHEISLKRNKPLLSDIIDEITPNLEQTSSDIKIQREVEEIDLPEETAIKLMLISPTNSSTFYSRTFKKNKHNMKNEQLISSFIRAIQGFSGEIFERKLERIKLEEYTITIDIEPDVILAYIYIGQSFSSQMKIKQFISNMYDDSQIIDSIKELNDKGLSPIQAVINKIDKIARDIFE